MSTQMSSPMATQLAGKGAGRAVKRKLHGLDKRPGWVTYGVLIAVVLISFYPIWFTILLASSNATDIARNCGLEVFRVERITEYRVGLKSGLLGGTPELSAEQTAQIHKCLSSLDARTQGHIRAAFFEGKTYAQLAEAADVPLGTMKSWIRRGLQRLRTCLEASEAA